MSIYDFTRLVSVLWHSWVSVERVLFHFDFHSRSACKFENDVHCLSSDSNLDSGATAIKISLDNLVESDQE